MKLYKKGNYIVLETNKPYYYPAKDTSFSIIDNNIYLLVDGKRITELNNVTNESNSVYNDSDLITFLAENTGFSLGGFAGNFGGENSQPASNIESGNNYIKFDNVLIQWGANSEVSPGDQNINYPIRYESTNYSLNVFEESEFGVNNLAKYPNGFYFSGATRLNNISYSWHSIGIASNNNISGNPFDL